MANQSDSLPQSAFPCQRTREVGQVLFLVGFMGAGKTTVGRQLAQYLGWRFVDLDDRIQLQAGRTIEDIFRQSGEAEFRLCETAALRELLREPESSPRVIALGGGAFVQPENLALIRANGNSIFLDAPVEELYRRCQRQQMNRPLSQNEDQFRKLHAERYRTYREATIRLDTYGKSAADIANDLIEHLGLHKI